MPYFWLLPLGCLSVIAFEFENNDTRIDGVNGWYVPLANGSWKWIDGKEELNLIITRNNRDLLNSVKFLLYTKLNPGGPQVITRSPQSIRSSNFNAAHPTKFVIHGWMQTHHANMYEQLREAFLSTGECNLIFVEWARAKSGYVSAFAAVPGVGKQVAAFADFLAELFAMSLYTLHVIGHSLGAHVAGFTAKNVQTGQIRIIIGLDPARPLYKYAKPAERLNSTDAFYVESIQTNCGNLGFEEPIGKATFYPNGGKSQPNCGVDIMGLCSHQRSVAYYAQSIIEATYACIPCESYENALAKDCGEHLSAVRMGAALNAFIAKGPYYVPIEN